MIEDKEINCPLNIGYWRNEIFVQCMPQVPDRMVTETHTNSQYSCFGCSFQRDLQGST